MRKKNVMLMLLLVVFCMALFACSTTTGYKETKDIETNINVTAESGSIVIFEAPVGVESRDESNTDQTTGQTITPDTDLALSQATNGATSASKLGAGLQALKDLKNSTTDDHTVDKSKVDSDNPIDNRVDNSTGNLPAGKSGDEVSVLDLTDSEEYTLHWSSDRARNVTWLKHPGAHYGVPILFEISGNCEGKYLIDKLDNKKYGSVAFTMKDDFFFGSENPKAAEVLAPKNCGQDGTTKLVVRFKA